MPRNVIPVYSNQWVDGTEISLPEVQAEFNHIYDEINKSALDADLVAHVSDKNNPHGVTAIQIGAVPIREALKTVDGAGSGLDADTLDGEQGAAFARVGAFGNYLFTGDVATVSNKQIFRTFTDPSQGLVLQINGLKQFGEVNVLGGLTVNDGFEVLTGGAVLGNAASIKNAANTAAVWVGRTTQVRYVNGTITQAVGYRPNGWTADSSNAVGKVGNPALVGKSFFATIMIEDPSAYLFHTYDVAAGQVTITVNRGGGLTGLFSGWVTITEVGG